MPLPQHMLAKNIDFCPILNANDVMVQWLVAEARDPHGIVPTSISTPNPNVYKAFEIIHMLWMGAGIYHHAITTTHVPLDFGFQLDFN